MFYICIPSNVVRIPEVWNLGYLIVLVDGINISINIKSFSSVIKCDNKNYYMYLLQCRLLQLWQSVSMYIRNYPYSHTHP